jgi:hypothetical protein
VWGAFGHDIAGIDVTGPPGAPTTATSFAGNGAFLALFGPGVRADQLTVTIRFKDGRVAVRHANTNLLPGPVPHPTGAP